MKYVRINGLRISCAVVIGLLLQLSHLAYAQSYASTSVWCVVDDHVRPLPGEPPNGWFYNQIGGDRGLLSDISVDPGGEAAYSRSSDSVYRGEILRHSGHWGSLGMWYALGRPASDSPSLDPTAIYHSVILPAFQPRLTGIDVVVSSIESPAGRDDLEFKVELKGHNAQGHQTLRGDWKWSGREQLLAGTFPKTFSVDIKPEALGGDAGVVLWMLDGATLGDAIEVDSVRLRVEMPELPIADEALLTSLGMLLHNYDDSTGMVQDRSSFPRGDFENVTATAKLAKILAMALEMGFVEDAAAKSIIAKIAETLLNVVPRGPTEINSLWPHFTYNGGTERISDSEWASGDTAYAVLDLIVALWMIGDPQGQLPQSVAMLKQIDWAALRAPNGGFYHGYDVDGGLLTGIWYGFGAETIGVILAALAGGDVLGEMGPPPSDNGSGFIYHAGYPIVPSGVDRWGNNWFALRYAEIESQLGWYADPAHTNPYLSDLGLFGLSAAERPEGWDPDPDHIYQAYGTGGQDPTALDGSNRVVALHYSGMIAQMQKEAAEAMWVSLRQSGVISPLNNLESMQVNPTSGAIEFINYLRGSWNLALQAEGWAMCHREAAWLAHDAIRNVPELAAAYDIIFPCSDIASQTPQRIGIGSGMTQHDTVQAAYDPVNDEIHVAHTRYNPGNGRKEIWLESLGDKGLRSWHVGYCYSNEYSHCPLSVAVCPTSGAPAVAYRGEDGLLVYGYLAGSTWFRERVSSVSGSPSLAFDPTDNEPAIAIHTAGVDYNLYVAKRNGTSWNVPLVSYANACFNSLKFSSDGAQHIAYKTLGWTGNPSRLWYSGPTGSGHVDGSPDYVGGGASLDFDNEGHPCISHVDHSNRLLKLASWTGSSWTNQVLDDSLTGHVTSLAMTDAGSFYVSYASSGAATNTLRLASRFDDSVWGIQTLAQASDLSPWSSTVTDGSGQAYTAYIAEGKVWLAEVTAEQNDAPTKADISDFIMHSGVNLPWVRYGWDLGANPWGGAPGGFASNRAALEEDFAFLKVNGVKMCRIFAFCDFRTGLLYDGTGNILGVDDYVYADMHALVEVSKSNSVQLVVALMDYTMADGVQWEDANLVGEHPDFITNSLRRAQLIDNVIKPFVREFGTNTWVDWDVINEPRLATAVPKVDMQSFVEECAAVIANECPDSKVSFGGYDRYHLNEYGNAACSETQVHYYDHMTNYWIYDTPASEISSGDVFFGEVSPTDLRAKLSAAVSNGYKGVLFWSLNANDGYSFSSVSHDYLDWVSSEFAGIHEGLGIKEISIRDGNPELTVSPTYPGGSYCVQYCTNLVEGVWHMAPLEFTGSAESNTTRTSLTSPGVSPLFFRVGAQL